MTLPIPNPESEFTTVQTSPSILLSMCHSLPIMLLPPVPVHPSWNPCFVLGVHAHLGIRILVLIFFLTFHQIVNGKWCYTRLLRMSDCIKDTFHMKFFHPVLLKFMPSSAPVLPAPNSLEAVGYSHHFLLWFLTMC